MIVVHCVQSDSYRFHHPINQHFLRHRSIRRQCILQRAAFIVIHHIVVRVGLVAFENATRATHATTRELGEERHCFCLINELHEERMEVCLFSDTLYVTNGHGDTFALKSFTSILYPGREEFLQNHRLGLLIEVPVRIPGSQV